MTPPPFRPFPRAPLYLGSLSAALSPAVLSQLGITHVLAFLPIDLNVRFPEGIKLLWAPEWDGDELRRRMPMLCRWIDYALGTGGRVLVHGWGGMAAMVAWAVREVR